MTAQTPWMAKRPRHGRRPDGWALAANRYHRRHPKGPVEVVEVWFTEGMFLKEFDTKAEAETAAGLLRAGITPPASPSE